MSDANLPESSSRYVAEFVDGPFAGRVEHRVLIDGRHEDEISEIADFGGQDRLFFYLAQDTREIEGVLHVHYSEDKRDSDPVQGNNEVDSLRF